MMRAYKYVGKQWKTKQSDVVRCLQSVRCYSEYSQHPFILPVAQTSRPAEAHHQLGFNASQKTKFGVQTESVTSLSKSMSSVSLLNRNPWSGLFQRSTVGPSFIVRYITTTGHTKESVSQDGAIPDVVPHIKFKRLDKTAKHIMQILDKEAVQEVRTRREIPDIKPGYIVQLKVEVPENKRRVSVLKGIVIARRNAGLNTTFRLRRLVAGVGVESVFPLYSPNIKEMKVLDKKKVRRAKLYYLRDKMNALKKQ